MAVRRPQAHIGAILLSKFTSYSDFHTQLYTCSAEFDFLDVSYPVKTSLTLLLPAACVAMVMVGWVTLRRVWGWRVQGEGVGEEGEDGPVDHLPEVQAAMCGMCRFQLSSNVYVLRLPFRNDIH